MPEPLHARATAQPKLALLGDCACHKTLTLDSFLSRLNDAKEQWIAMFSGIMINAQPRPLGVCCCVVELPSCVAICCVSSRKFKCTPWTMLQAMVLVV